MERTPLATIFDNRIYNTELNSFQRGLIVGAKMMGYGATDIGTALNIPRTTAKTTIEKHGHSNNGVVKPRSGRPHLFADRDRRSLIRLVRKNPKMTYAQISRELDVVCSRKTVYREIKAYGLTNWLAKKRPLLTEEVAQKRCSWCLARRDWMYEEWSKYIWSDECSVEKGSGKDRTWVFRFPWEKWKKEMIKPVPKGKGVSIMVWACFWGDGRSELYKLCRDFEAKKMGYSANSYIEVLEDNLLGLWEPGLTFMQDNAPIHTAKKVTKWFEDTGITVTDWPPYSPDLNPIEHLWNELKKLVYRVRPDIDDVTDGDEKVREALWKTLEEAWELIDHELMRGLIVSKVM